MTDWDKQRDYEAEREELLWLLKANVTEDMRSQIAIALASIQKEEQQNLKITNHGAWHANSK